MNFIKAADLQLPSDFQAQTTSCLSNEEEAQRLAEEEARQEVQTDEDFRDHVSE